MSSGEKLSPLARSALHRSPYLTPKHRTILGRIDNSCSPRRTGKLSCLLQDRQTFDKENVPHGTLRSSGFRLRSELAEEETRFGFFEGPFDGNCENGRAGGSGLVRKSSFSAWTLAQVSDDSPNATMTPLKNTDSCDSGYPPSIQKPTSPLIDEETIDFQETIDYEEAMDYVPQVPTAEAVSDNDFESLHDLEEFDLDVEKCSKYEIISTDSPNIISRGSSTRMVSSKNLVFGAPLADSEKSTSFNRNPSARALNFDEAFDFASPTRVRTQSVKKTLKFCSPGKENTSPGQKTTTPPSRNRFRLFTSESSTSVESGFISESEDAFTLDAFQESGSPRVADFADLLSGQIKQSLPTDEAMVSTPTRPLFRSMSLSSDRSIDKVRMSLFTTSPGSRARGFKRPEPPAEGEARGKRRKGPQRAPLLRALSENCADDIISALARSASNPDLIGDFSRPCALPLTGGSHADLKSISGETLAGLLRGEYAHTVTHFQVIDCRYPYEFAGGHIQGAKNLYTHQHILQLLNEPETHTDAFQYDCQSGASVAHSTSVRQSGASVCHSTSVRQSGASVCHSERRVLVFHCEFSLERGPKLSRFLRATDRAANKDCYPSLRYPEVYLLHQGYSAFFNQHPELCTPRGYTQMLDPAFRKDLAAHRSAPLGKSTSADFGKVKSRLLM